MTGDRYDVVIVGAGIIGAACAWEIARRGPSVLVLEAGEVAAGTSCRAMGHLGIYDESDAQLDLSIFARERWDEIADELPAAVEYVRRGSLWIAADAADLEEAARKAERLRRRGIEAALLDATTLYETEPNLQLRPVGGAPRSG